MFDKVFLLVLSLVLTAALRSAPCPIKSREFDELKDGRRQSMQAFGLQIQ